MSSCCQRMKILRMLLKLTPFDPWKTMSFIRRYILFKKPAWKKSENLGFLCNRPRCVRKFSSAALGRGV